MYETIKKKSTEQKRKKEETGDEEFQKKNNEIDLEILEQELEKESFKEEIEKLELQENKEETNSKKVPQKRRTKNITIEQEKELLRKAQQSKGTEQQNAIRQLIYSNLNLVKYIITRYFSSVRVAYEELVDAGIRSLFRAITKFDLKSNNRLAVYAGFWIKQYIRSYIEKTQMIKPSLMNSRDVVYYDDIINQNDEKNINNLLDNLSSDSYETDQEEIRQHDVARVINDLINSAKSRETRLFIRLFFKISPTNLWDLYQIMTEKERKDLITDLEGIRIKVKVLNDSKTSEQLTKQLLEKNKFNKLNSVKKYVDIFAQVEHYKFSEIAKIIGKSENCIRRLKKDSIIKLGEIAKSKKVAEMLGY